MNDKRILFGSAKLLKPDAGKKYPSVEVGNYLGVCRYSR